MTFSQEENMKSLFADKRVLQRMVAEQYATAGLVYDPTATAEQARLLIMEDGVRPEDNLFSCGIIAAREQE